MLSRGGAGGLPAVVLWLNSGPMTMSPGQLIMVMEPGWEAEARHTPTLPWRLA